MSHTITLVIPVYNEADIIAHTVSCITALFEHAAISHMVLVVDDGSTDATWTEIERIVENNSSVHGLRLSRNFGKENAICAGLANAGGDCVIVMDGDMQHPPETALAMFRLWEQGGYDIVEGVKTHRPSETYARRSGAKIFYTLLKKLSGLGLENMSDFKLLSRRAVDVITEMPERYVFFRAMTGWTGLPTGRVYFETAPRVGGGTKFNMRSLFKLAVDSIVSFSSAPLQLVTLTGTGFIIFAGIMAIQTLYMKISGRSVEGFTTVILLLLIIGGVLMISLGIIGVYIAKIYNEIKQRPRYIISERTKNL